MEEEIDLRPYINALLKYWWLILASALLGGILVYFYIANQPPSYQASALITVLEPTEVLQFDPRVINTPSRNALLKVLPELAKSDQVIGTLKDRLEENGGSTIDGWGDNLVAQAGRDPILLYLRVNNGDPESAAEIANIWAEVFVTLGNDVYVNQGESRLKFYENQLVAASDRLDAANDALAEFQGQNRLAAVTNELTALTLTHASVISHTTALRTLRDDIQAARIQQEQLSANPITQTDELTALALQARAMNLQESLPFVFQSTSEGVSGYTRQDQMEFLDSLDAFVTELENASSTRLVEMESELMGSQQEYEQLNSQASRLTVERDLALETYSTLTRKLDEERIGIDDTNTGFRIASRAEVPSSPDGMNQLLAAFIGAALGVILSSVTIILYSWWRQ